MTIAQARTYINTYLIANGVGGIDGSELNTALLALCENIEANASWTPVMTLVADSARYVLKITDWTGGIGTKPTVNIYMGATGYVANIAQAVDIRGATGPTGAASSSSLLGVTANNPAAGLLIQILNSAVSAWTGAKMEFSKNNIGSWRIGMPAGTDNAFTVQGYGGATFPELVRISDNGNLTIGSDATADFRLKVTQANPSSGWLSAFSNSATTGRTGAKILFDQIGLADWAIGQPAGVDAFIIEGGPGILERLRVNLLGNMGLGTNNPAARLDVFYTAGATGLKVGNGNSILESYIGYSDGKNYFRGTTILADTTADNVGIGLTIPTEKLDVSGRVRTKGLVTTGTLPTIVKGAAVGSTGTAVLITNSTDMSGGITLTTTATTTTNGVLATITFTSAYARAGRVQLTAANAIAANHLSRIWAVATASGFTLNSGISAFDQGVTLEFSYLIIA